MRSFPEHAGFFRIRELTSEERLATDLPELTPKDFPYLNEQKGGWSYAKLETKIYAK